MKDPRSNIPDIEVTFPNGQLDKLKLKHYNALPRSTNIDHSRLCNYLGHLQHEKDATVAVTGCADVNRNIEGKIFITLISKQSPDQKLFVIHLKDDETHITSRSGKREKRHLFEAQEVAAQTETILTTTDVFEGDEVKDKELEAKVSKAADTGVPCSIKAKIKIGTDLSASNTIQSNLQMSVDNWLAEMFTHVQSHYYHPSLQHRINFEVRLICN